MKQITFLLCSIFITFAAFAQPVVWSLSGGNNGGSTIDPDGNVYTIRTMQSSGTIHLGVDLSTDYTLSSGLAIYITKTNANGEFIWEKNITICHFPVTSLVIKSSMQTMAVYTA